MVTSSSIANATIALGASYDSSKFILGDAVHDKIQLVPKLTQTEVAHLAKASNVSVGYKVYNVTSKKLLQWDSSDWIPVNDTVAGHLAANTAAGQTVIKICDTASPTPGQVLTATSATTAVWADGGGGGPTVTNASYTTLIGNGTDTTIPVSHNLNTESVVYGIWEATGQKRVVDCSVSIVSVNALSFHFNTAPAAGAYRVTIISAVFSNAVPVPPGVPDQTGHDGKFLKTDGFNATWQIAPTGIPSMTGQSGKYLTTDGNVPYWYPVPTWMANPMSASGDIIIGGAVGAAGRLGKGTEGQVLTTSGNTLSWTTQVPSVAGNSGKFLTNDGTNTSWGTIANLLNIDGTVSNKLLSNNGTTTTWVVNTTPPDITGQAGKFLTNNGTVTSWSSISQVPSPSGHSGHVLTNDGGTWFWRKVAEVLPSLTGQTGKYLTNNGTDISWDNPPTGFDNPMTTLGDLIVADSLGNAIRLARGTTGQFLSVLGNGSLGWANTLDNPMTTYGDIIYGGSSGTPTRLGIPASGYFLGSNGSVPTWVQGNLVPTVSGQTGKWLTNNGTIAQWSSFTMIPDFTGQNGKYLSTDGSNVSWTTIPAGFANPMISAGDMISATAGGNASRLPIGSDGQFLTVASGQPAWTTIQTLPSQTGHNGQFLTSNGTAASWSQVYQVPTVTGNAGKFLGTSDGITYGWMLVPNVLPTMTGQGGKYLSTDGTSANWIPYNGLPDLSGNSGKILSTDGVTSFWIAPSGASGGSLSRLPIVVTSSVLTVTSDEIKVVDTTCKTFQIQGISSDIPCRVRIYATNTAAVLDRSRLSTLDPTGDHQMYFEAILSQAVPSISCSPMPTCANLDTPITTNIYMTIQNLSTITSAVTITLDLMKFE